MQRFAMLIAVLLTASAIGNCNSAKLVASVKNPSYSGQRFKKVLVIGMSDDPAIRSDFEDALATKLARDGVEAIPGPFHPAAARLGQHGHGLSEGADP